MGFPSAESGEHTDQRAAKHQAERLKEDTTILKERRLKAEEDKAARGADAPAPKR